MIKTIDPIGSPVTIELIDAFEETINSALPSDYRNFLIKYNGGKPTPGDFKISSMPLNPSGRIDYFYGLNVNHEVYELLWDYSISRNSYPDSISIACTPSGDQIIMNIRGENGPEIFLWDYYEGINGVNNRYYIAPDFTNLISGLFDDDQAS